LDKKCFIIFIISPRAGALRKVWSAEHVTWKGQIRSTSPILWKTQMESAHYKNQRGERIILKYITGKYAQGL
jgi:hypothetical protein